MDGFKVSKGERVWCAYYSLANVPMFVITSKKDSREVYFIYEFKDGELKKLGKSKSPGELERKYNVKNKITE